MAERAAGEDAQRRVLIERGHRVVFGYLGPAILHETNNVLTVMTGVRQLLKMSRTLSDKVGEMIDQQLDKSERLLECMRGIGPEPNERGGADLGTLQEAIVELLRLAGKGRGLTVLSTAPEEAIRLAAGVSEPLALGLLCGALPLMPPRSPGVRATAELRAGRDGGGPWLACRVEPAPGLPAGTPEVELAGGLLELVGGALEWQQAGAGSLEVRAGLGGAVPSGPSA